MRNNLKTVTPLLHLALCIFLIIFLSACGEAIYSSSETGSIAFSLELQGDPNEIAGPSQAINCEDSGVSTVEAKVYDEDGSLIASGGPWECLVHSGTITSVPAGSNRKVVILGKDASGSVLYSGAFAGITVTAGQTNDVGPINLFVQDQVWYTGADFPSDFITEKGGQGYRITSLAYGDGMWAVVMSQGTGYTDQVWYTGADFPSDFISEKWNEQYNISSLAYGDGMWAVVMSLGPDYLQWWATRSDFLEAEDFIYVNWDEGYRITELVYGATSGVNVWAVYGQL